MSLDNRGPLFRALFRLTNYVRGLICRLPQDSKNFVCDVIAATVYWPLAKLAFVLKNVLSGFEGWRKLPLSFYHDRSFTVMRNDSLDRFGTPLEQRFSRKQCHEMMKTAGLVDIRFMDQEPYWCMVGTRPT